MLSEFSSINKFNDKMCYKTLSSTLKIPSLGINVIQKWKLSTQKKMPHFHQERLKEGKNLFKHSFIHLCAMQ